MFALQNSLFDRYKVGAYETKDNATQSPWLTIAKRPILSIDKYHADKDILLPHIESAVQIIGQLSKESNFLFLGISHCTGDLNDDDIRASLDAQEIWVPDKVVLLMLADNHESITFRGLRTKKEI